MYDASRTRPELASDFVKTDPTFMLFRFTHRLREEHFVPSSNAGGGVGLTHRSGILKVHSSNQHERLCVG